MVLQKLQLYAMPMVVRFIPSHLYCVYMDGTGKNENTRMSFREEMVCMDELSDPYRWFTLPGLVTVAAPGAPCFVWFESILFLFLKSRWYVTL